MRHQAIQVVDLGFGDGGKGSMVDYLASRYNAAWVVRFNGGPQAGHNVVLGDGRHHTFAQFGSATFQPGARTLLSRFMLIDPYALLNEAAHLEELGVTDALDRLWIDERCLVITPPQQIANRLRERARGPDAHGTCGIGVGECMSDFVEEPEFALHAGELGDAVKVTEKFRASLDRKSAELKDWLPLATADERRVLDDASWIGTAVEIYRAVAERVHLTDAAGASEILRESSCTVFEGAQGVLLDERFGFYPHTTWSKSTFTNSDTLLDDAGSDAERHRLGVTRCYAVRHGNGPFPTEDESLNRMLHELHNRDDGSAGRFRRGVLDLVMLRYAIRACDGVDGLALTCLDQLRTLPSQVCDGYELDGRDFLPVHCSELSDMALLTLSMNRVAVRHRHWPSDSADAFLEALQSSLGKPIGYLSFGPTREQKRPWNGRREAGSHV